MANARKDKEKAKDPQYRLEKFAKTAKTENNLQTQPMSSGSFGGKIKTFQGKRAGKKAGSAIRPAWLIVPNISEDGSDDP